MKSFEDLGTNVSGGLTNVLLCFSLGLSRSTALNESLHTNLYIVIWEVSRSMGQERVKEERRETQTGITEIQFVAMILR